MLPPLSVIASKKVAPCKHHISFNAFTHVFSGFTHHRKIRNPSERAAQSRLNQSYLGLQGQASAVCSTPTSRRQTHDSTRSNGSKVERSDGLY